MSFPHGSEMFLGKRRVCLYLGYYKQTSQAYQITNSRKEMPDLLTLHWFNLAAESQVHFWWWRVNFHAKSLLSLLLSLLTAMTPAFSSSLLLKVKWKKMSVSQKKLILKTLRNLFVNSRCRKAWVPHCCPKMGRDGTNDRSQGRKP